MVRQNRIHISDPSLLTSLNPRFTQYPTLTLQYQAEDGSRSSGAYELDIFYLVISVL